MQQQAALSGEHLQRIIASRHRISRLEPSERLAFPGIRGPIKGHLEPLEHYSNIVSRGFREPSIRPIMPSDASLSDSRLMDLDSSVFFSKAFLNKIFKAFLEYSES